MRGHGWWQGLVIFTCATMIALLMGSSWSFLQILLVVPAYFIGRRCESMHPAMIGFGGGLTAQLALSWMAEPSSFLSVWFTALVTDFFCLLLPWWLGRWLRLREIRRFQEDAIITELARVRERTRIAEDMHDLIGHDLALISLHSGALEVQADASDEQKRAASQIRARAVAATDRLHEILGVLRTEETTPRRAPGGHDLERIVDSARASGMDVDITVSGSIAAEAVARAVERVVQESLTNAAKHAPGARVAITVDARGEGVEVSVANERGGGSSIPAEAVDSSESNRETGRDSSRSGMGLVAAEERIRLLGGTMSAEPDHGGFRVSASIPQMSDEAASRTQVGSGTQTASGAQTASGTQSASRADGTIGRSDGAVGRQEDAVAKERIWRAHRSQRASMRRAALVPGVCAAVLLVALVVFQFLTYTSVGLPSDRFAQIHIGQSESEAEAVLPRSHVDLAGVPPTITVPSAQPGSSCEFYLARESVVDFGNDIYRICTRDGVITAAERLSPEE